MVARLRAVLVTGALVLVACNPTPPSISPSPSASPSPSPSPAATGPVAACAPVPPTPEPSGPQLVTLGGGYGPQDGPDGGTIVVGDRHAATRYDPLAAESGGDLEVNEATWAGLVTQTGELRYLPDLATGVPTIANGRVSAPGTNGDAMTVTWCLRDGLGWSDGAPLTCDDFAYARAWLHDIAEPSVAARYGDLRAIDCPTPDVLVARYGTVFAGYVGRMVPPLPRHYLERIPPDQLRAGAGFRPDELAILPVSGPFRFVSVTTNEVRLARNAFYRGAYRAGPAHLDALTFRWFPTDAAAIAAYRAGAIDVAADLDRTDPMTLVATELAPEISSIPSFTYETLRLNWSAKPGADGGGGCSTNTRVLGRGAGCPVADQAIRAALAAAIDVDAVNRALLGPDEAQRASLVSPAAYFFVDIAPVVLDPAAAELALAQAGWVDPTGSGVRSNEGLRAIVELCVSDDPRHVDAARIVAADAAAVGIEVVVHAVSEAKLLARFEAASRKAPCAISRSNFDIALEPITSSINPSDFRLRYHSLAFEPAGRNDARVSDPNLDADLDGAATTADFVVTKHSMEHFQRDAAALTVEIPLSPDLRIDVVHHLGNFFANAATELTWNASDWFVLP